MEEGTNLFDELVAAPSLRFGLYGKLPAIGDFIVRGLARNQVEPVDQWLQHGLGTLQQSDPDWLQPYLVTPAWCFVLPRGQWGEAALCGVLMPSVDRVGRYFPLVALAELSEVQAADHPGLCSHLGELAAAMPSVLHEGLDPDAFMAKVDGLGFWPLSAPATVPSVFERFAWDDDCSLWWAATRPDQPYRQVSHRGRPDADLFRCLFGPRQG